MRRREFIAGLGTSSMWPITAGAQQDDRITAHRRAHAGRRKRSPGEASPLCVHASACGLGWSDGRNVRIDLRGGGGDINRINARIPELIFEARDMVRRLMHPCQEAL
jgi:hypothetical protein